MRKLRDLRPSSSLPQLQAVHQHIGVVEQPYHHKDLRNLGIGVTELLHGSRVEVESRRTIIQG